MTYKPKEQPLTDEELTEQLKREEFAVMCEKWRVRKDSPTEVETDEPHPRLVLNTGMRVHGDERVKNLNEWIARYVVELHNKEMQQA